MGASVEPSLISIGAIHENGRDTFYAELTDTWKPGDCTAFVRDNVLPQLDGGAARAGHDEAGERLARWIAGLGGEVQLITDSARSDGPWIGDLLAGPGYPTNLQHTPRSIRFADEDQQEAFLHALDKAFAGGLRRHHALDVARANREAWIEVCAAGVQPR